MIVVSVRSLEPKNPSSSNIILILNFVTLPCLRYSPACFKFNLSPTVATDLWYWWRDKVAVLEWLYIRFRMRAFFRIIDYFPCFPCVKINGRNLRRDLVCFVVQVKRKSYCRFSGVL